MRNERLMSRWYAITAVLVVVPWLAAGCSWGPKVWVERTEAFSVPADDVRVLSVETHNGGVTVQGADDRTELSVTARVRGGGKSKKAAEASLAAIELVSDRSADGEHRLGWRWTKLRQQDWSAEVSFKVEGPQRLELDVHTHNGAVTVEHLSGDCRLKTHNGPINASDIAGRLVARTHNGAIGASISGSAVELITHNGGVQLDATACRQLGGEVVSHNGALRVEVGMHTSAEISAETHNGGVHCSADLKDIHSSRTRVTGQLGDGGPTLVARTHNGGVRVVQR